MYCMPKKAPSKTPRPKKYVVEAVFNGTSARVESNSLFKAFRDIKPEFLLTEMFITVRKGEAFIERRFSLIHGRKFFANKDQQEAFISSLVLP